jgi:hypothetical protein
VDKPWKRQERQVAAMLGTTRNPNNGRPQADIDAGPFAVEHKARKALPAWEHKARKALPAWLSDALQQAQRRRQDAGRRAHGSAARRESEALRAPALG